VPEAIYSNGRRSGDERYRICDYLEALIAALFCDGSLETAKSFVMKYVWEPHLPPTRRAGSNGRPISTSIATSSRRPEPRVFSSSPNNHHSSPQTNSGSGQAAAASAQIQILGANDGGDAQEVIATRFRLERLMDEWRLGRNLI